MRIIITILVLLLTGCSSDVVNQRGLLTQFAGNNAPGDPEPRPVLVSIRNV
ncbi:TPA: cytolethal distending toxin type IV subunit CdtC, partial [Escherichia coli]